MSKICLQCSRSYDDSDTWCDVCGIALDEEDEVTSCDADKIPTLILYETRDKKTLRIRERSILQREKGMLYELFDYDDTVSEPHCEVFYEGGSWKISNLKPTSSTWIKKRNEKELKMPYGTSHPLVKGDYVRIGCRFLFRVDFEREEQRVKKMITVWEVICPVCKKAYRVACKEERVKECTGACKESTINRTRIARILPKMKEVEDTCKSTE